ncbi:hypothetical protein [Fischerella sp. PCC 9605]|uniref:hypothetical protein n=1 Tax=Fischerella sp. PCC 9605 TaxID=1173024 RepID=UPI00047ED880|nr:hypothetical protein [Fischerella sp. PCC 9605]
MAKPTGELGYLRASIDENCELKSSFEKIHFSKEKDAVEQHIVSCFINSANKEINQSGETFFLSNPVKKPLDDFDFEVSTPKGTAYLELMEAAPLERIKGGYAHAPQSYKPYDFAQNIFKKILDKSQKYSKSRKHDELFLLIYVTHWTFVLSETTIDLLRYFCNQQQTIFKAIFLYTPLDEKEGVVKFICPVPPEFLQEIDPEKYKENVVLNLDPKKFKTVIKREP